MAHHNVSIMADLFHLSQHDGSASFPVSHWGLWKINRLTNTHTKSPPFAFPTFRASWLYCHFPHLYFLFLWGEHFKSPLRCTLSATFTVSLTPSVIPPPLFFFLCAFPLYFDIFMWGIPPHHPHKLPIPAYCPALLSILSSLSASLACTLSVLLHLFVRDSACLIYKRCSVSHSIPRFKNCLFFGCCFLQEFSLFCECAWMAHCFTSYIV